MSKYREFALDKLEALRERLLDLTSRNRMINSNFNASTKQHFRIIDEVPQQIFESLTKSSMIFKPLPPIEEEPADERKPNFQSKLQFAIHSDLEYQVKLKEIRGDVEKEELLLRELKDKLRSEMGLPPFKGKNISIKEHARNNGINPDFDLPSDVTGEKKYQDNKIQTIYLQDQLKSYLNTIFRNFRSSQKESGVNTLYFCFGFLEWDPSVSGGSKLTSPVLMLQVQLDEKKKGSPLRVSSTGDEISLNLSLNEKLKKEFRVELPALPELKDEEALFDLEDYFAQVEKFASDQNWGFKRWVSFGIYNAQNMPIYKDLENIKKSGLGDLLAELLEGTDRSDGRGSTSEIYDVDSQKSRKLVPALVRSADSSQYSAVIDALEGKNIVLKGPPGTGKSQTITNMIAALCQEGKKVLFVAQKQAALDVVRNNLEAIGNEDYLLEIFSIKANKKAVMDSLRKRNEKEEPRLANLLDSDLKQLNKVKDQLNEYSNFINKTYEKTEKTIHDLLWDQIDIEQSYLEKFEGYEVSKPHEITDSSLEFGLSQLDMLKDFCERYFEDIDIFNSELRLIKNKVVQPTEQEKYKKMIKELESSFSENFYTLKLFQEKNPALEEITLQHFFESESISKWNEKEGKERDLINFFISLDERKVINDYIEKRADYEKHETKFADKEKLINETFDYDEDSIYSKNDIKKAAKELIETSFMSFFSRDWWKARKTFNNLTVLPPNERNMPSAEAGKQLQNLHKFLQSKDKDLENIENLKKIFNGEESRLLKLTEESLLNEVYLQQEEVKTILSDLESFDQEFIKCWTGDHELIENYLKHSINLKDDLDHTHKLFKELAIDFDLPGEMGTLNSFEELSLFLSKLNDQSIHFSNYMTLLVQEEEIKDINASKFYEKFCQSGININEANSLYKHFVRDAQKNHIRNNSPHMFAKYAGAKIDSLRSQLSELDQKVEKKYQQQVANTIHGHGRSAPSGNSVGKVDKKTDMGLVEHLSSVQTPRMSIRQFIGNASDAIMALKPCSLMSPMSVSQTLPLRKLFDVVVIDEASQMKPEYALGAIARAKQAIIVGDPNQLPPTSFYQSTSSEDEWDDDLGDESILDMAMTVFYPPRELLWHYRSRHEDLIKFSNAKFYQNLLIPVTADGNKKNRGITYRYLEDGVYKTGTQGSAGGINLAESKAVVDAVFKAMKERPDESIGVATMNIKQKELIQNEFDMRAAKDLAVQKYLIHWSEKNQGLEEFFVKNLENVQGDERDLIIISTVYGPNETGNVYQRFGPINSKHGARRLNVLFSRAKNEIQLFTSLKAAQVTVSESSSKGLEVFKDYLTFAETGILQEGEQTEYEVDNPFQQWAIDMINSFPGYSAKHEIGVQGYRIDIGVEHEDYPHGFIMGVETDGASYHSSRSARDRDKLRQDILEGHGWVFHRIWSTDWIDNPVGEKERLRKALDNRLEELLKDLKAATDIAADRSEASVSDDSDEEVASTPLQDTDLDSYPYIPTDLDEYITVRPERFDDKSYINNTVKDATKAIIDSEGPVSINVIVSRIRDAHGFKKAGNKMRTTIASAIPSDYRSTTFKYDGNETRFYWPKDFDPKEWKAARFPQGDDENSHRDLQDICPQEIKAIALQSDSSDNIAKEVSDFLGFSACSSQMSNYINKVLET